MTDNLTPAEGLAAHIINTLEPIAFDGFGAALYCHQLACHMQDKSVADAGRIMAKRVDDNQE